MTTLLDPATTSPTITTQLLATGTADVIVILKAASLATGSTVIATSRGRSSSPAGDLSRYFIPSQRSQLLASTVAASAVAARGRSSTAKSSPPLVRIFPALGVMLGSVDAKGLAGLQQDGRVAAVTGAAPISLIRPVAAGAESQDLSEAGSGGRLLNVPALWKLGFRGKGVVVAHLDTGVDGGHPALKGAVGQFAEFDWNGDQVQNAAPHDSDEHGTHTAATIVGRAIRGHVIGVAPEAQLASAMVIEGGQVVVRVLAGLNWALTQGVKVLSMSLGIRGYVPDFLQVFQILRARGVLPVIAVGNEGPGTSRSPGNYVEALSVGACDSRKTVAPFSGGQSFNRSDNPIVPDLIAPGVDILSAVPGGKYEKMSGTSMATPHVAGLAALLFQAVPGATVDDVENAIFKSCKRGANDLEARVGRGLPDALVAYSLLVGSNLQASTGRRTSGRKTARKKAPAKAKPSNAKRLTSQGRSVRG